MRLTIALLPIVLFSFPAAAQFIYMPYRPPQPSSAYLAITGGALWPRDATISGGGTIGGVPATSSARAKFNTDYIASGIIGLQPSRYVSFEIEGGYTHLKIKSGTGSVTLAGGTTTTGALAGSGNAILGFGNLLLWPLGADAPLAPYLGGGGGVAAFEGSATVDGLSISTNGRKATSAAAAIAGIDFGGLGAFRIGARYKYMWLAINNSRFKDVQAQAAMAVLSARY